jgi:hypothetical protein
MSTALLPLPPNPQPAPPARAPRIPSPHARFVRIPPTPNMPGDASCPAGTIIPPPAPTTFLCLYDAPAQLPIPAATITTTHLPPAIQPSSESTHACPDRIAANPINCTDPTGLHGYTPGKGMEAEYHYDFDPVPGALTKKQAPPLEAREFGDSIRYGQNDQNWYFFAETTFLSKRGDFLSSHILSIKGSLHDRWYWATTDSAEREEKREQEIIVKYWHQFADIVAEWRPFTAIPRIDCYISLKFDQAAAAFLNAAADWFLASAQVDIFSEDLADPNHPTQRYRDNLNSAMQRKSAAMLKGQEAKATILTEFAETLRLNARSDLAAQILRM